MIMQAPLIFKIIEGSGMAFDYCFLPQATAAKTFEKSITTVKGYGNRNLVR
jgi:hypothetical protein